jgi:predicted membrane-bound mannosyltransferase
MMPGINGDEAFLGAHAYDVSRGIPFSWRTPTGNIENPFSFLPEILVQKIFGPSSISLRIVSVVSGLLIIPANYLLCKKVYGNTTAIVSTLLLTVLPVNIVYSRFGWEPCQSVLFSIFLIYGVLLFRALRCFQWVRDKASSTFLSS